MNPRLIVALGCLASLAVALISSAQPEQGPPPGVDVLARGPVHEAFAEPIIDQPKQGDLVAKQPPGAIEEVPPDEKPAGDNVQWIPGYWAWDADTSNYLWVSGFWREMPPGRHWVPGHWQGVEGGWLWVSGFWAPDTLEQITYLPPPPPSIEAGPSTPALNATDVYVGGCWVYQNRYLWRPGHWIIFRPGWVWIPAHYVWTPVGCVFIDGYWDYPLDGRGLLFAPCRFDLAVWLRRPFVPQFVVHTDFLIGAFFVGPHRHYFFGDYFEERYVKRGFVAWNEYHPRKGMVDPNFAYFRGLHRDDPKWETSLHGLYDGRRTGTIPRPPVTLNQQVQVVNNITINKTTNVTVNKNINITNVQNVTALSSIKDVKNVKVTSLGSLTPGVQTKVPPRPVKIEAVPKDVHAREVKAATQIQQFAVQRQTTEAKVLNQGNIPVKHTDAPKTVPLAIPKPVPHVTTPPPTSKAAPPLPKVPQHIEQPIPKYDPHKPPAPPKKDKG